MTEEDSKVMELLHKKEIANKVLENNVQDVTHFMGTPAFDVAQAELDEEVEERYIRDIDPNIAQEMNKETEFVEGDLFRTDEQLKTHIQEEVDKTLREMTPDQYFNLGIVVLGGEQALLAEFTTLSRKKTYEILKVERGKFFNTTYRPVSSDSRVIVIKLPPKQS